MVKLTDIVEQLDMSAPVSRMPVQAPKQNMFSRAISAVKSYAALRRNSPPKADENDEKQSLGQAFGEWRDSAIQRVREYHPTMPKNKDLRNLAVGALGAVTLVASVIGYRSCASSVSPLTPAPTAATTSVYDSSDSGVRNHMAFARATPEPAATVMPMPTVAPMPSPVIPAPVHLSSRSLEALASISYKGGIGQGSLTFKANEDISMYYQIDGKTAPITKMAKDTAVTENLALEAGKHTWTAFGFDPADAAYVQVAGGILDVSNPFTPSISIRDSVLTIEDATASVYTLDLEGTLFRGNLTGGKVSISLPSLAEGKHPVKLALDNGRDSANYSATISVRGSWVLGPDRVIGYTYALTDSNVGEAGPSGIAADLGISSGQFAGFINTVVSPVPAGKDDQSQRRIYSEQELLPGETSVVFQGQLRAVSAIGDGLNDRYDMQLGDELSISLADANKYGLTGSSKLRTISQATWSYKQEMSGGLEGEVTSSLPATYAELPCVDSQMAEPNLENPGYRENLSYVMNVLAANPLVNRTELLNVINSGDYLTIDESGLTTMMKDARTMGISNRHIRSRLTGEDVAAIRTMYTENDLTVNQVISRFEDQTGIKMSRSTYYRIRSADIAGQYTA